jgi:hypothetical protein
MQSLGYPATWPTSCFISGGCGETVFAHTNGFGDFVLFDELGPPWPVHECYANRFLLTSSGSLIVREDRRAEYRGVAISGPPAKPRTVERITKMDPTQHVGGKHFLAIGYVQDYVERRVDSILKKTGTLGRQILERAFGNRRSQLTLVTTELKSYTVFADLSRVVLQRKDIICARVTAVPVLGMPGMTAVFLADEILTMRGDSGEGGQ